MTLEAYVKSVHRFRKDSEKTGYNDITRTAFWDLRAVILCYPTIQLSDRFLKRGYAMAMENLNTWKMRLFRILNAEEFESEAKKASADETLNPLFQIGYFSCENDQEVLKKSFNLLDIYVVDISPKTSVSDSIFQSLSKAGVDNLDDMIVFKVTLHYGRRYTFAAPESIAFRWSIPLPSFLAFFFLGFISSHLWISLLISLECIVSIFILMYL